MGCVLSAARAYVCVVGLVVSYTPRSAISDAKHNRFFFYGTQRHPSDFERGRCGSWREANGSSTVTATLGFRVPCVPTPYGFSVCDGHGESRDRGDLRIVFFFGNLFPSVLLLLDSLFALISSHSPARTLRVPQQTRKSSLKLSPARPRSQHPR